VVEILLTNHRYPADKLILANIHWLNICVRFTGLADQKTISISRIEKRPKLDNVTKI
jgi:hypothetical protein